MVELWKEQFEELLTPHNVSWWEEAENEDLGEDPYISFAKIAEVVNKLLYGKAR